MSERIRGIVTTMRYTNRRLLYFTFTYMLRTYTARTRCNQESHYLRSYRPLGTFFSCDFELWLESTVELDTDRNKQATCLG